MLPAIDIHCPYCGEGITVLVDDSAGKQHYIEDCQVCCRPIEIAVTVDLEGCVRLSAAAEGDA